MSKKPQTDEEARQACRKWCRRFTSPDRCEAVGTITVETRRTCYLAGYADWRPGAHHGKVPHYPPCL